MSIEEMKLKAIKCITTLKDEEVLKSILIELDKDEKKSEPTVHNLSQHFESISKRYDSTLKKLAQ